MQFRDMTAEFHQIDPRRFGHAEAALNMILDTHLSCSVPKWNIHRLIRTYSQPDFGKADDMPEDDAIRNFVAQAVVFRGELIPGAQRRAQIHLGNVQSILFSCAAE